MLGCRKNNSLKNKKIWLEHRLIFENPEGEKGPEQQKAPVKAEETFDQRKLQAKHEVDEIYDLGEYNTYNFRKLPQEFKDHMKNDFSQWVDANVAKYDVDKNSGIDAKEYQQFKTDLTQKVKSVLDRLAQIKTERKEQAKAEAESAAEAKDRQQLLEKGKAAIAEGKPLEGLEGIQFQLIAFQDDFKSEAAAFSQMMTGFGKAKNTIEEANKGSAKGLSALGNFAYSLAPWTDDLPEVEAAKKAKADAIADMQQKIAEMKQHQKDRQARGAKLNTAPEEMRLKIKQKYDGFRQNADLRQQEIEKQQQLNAAKKEQMEKAKQDVAKAKEDLQSRTDRKEGEERALHLNQEEFDKKAQETGTFENALTQAIQKLQQTIDQTPEPQKQELIAKLQKLTESQKKAEAGKGALEAAGQVAEQKLAAVEGSKTGAKLTLGNLDIKLAKVEDVIKFCDTTTENLDTASQNIGNQVIDLNANEQQELAQVDAMDKAIADTILEVDTSNFEMINQAGKYLQSLQSMEVKGPGAIDTVGLTLKGIPGVETAGNFIGDVAGKSWEWMKGTPVIGDGIQIVGYMGEGWSKGIEGIGQGLAWVGDKLHLQDAWDAMSNASDSLPNMIKTNNPILSVAKIVIPGAVPGVIIEVFAGVTEGLKDVIKGFGMVAAHPFEAMKGIVQLINHPSMVTDAFLQRDKWHSESSSKIIGRMMVDVVSTLSGAGAAAQGVKAASTGVRVGGLTFREAAVVGLKTGGRVLAEDIGGLAKGLVKLPGSVLKGTGHLAQTLANGGKAGVKLAREGKVLATIGEATRATVKELAATTAKEQKAAKALQKAQDSLLDPEKMAAYQKLQNAKGNPAEYKKILEENPRVVDMAQDYEKSMKKHGDKAKDYESELIKNPDFNKENKEAYLKWKAAKESADPEVYKKFAAENPDAVAKAEKYGKIEDALQTVEGREKLHAKMGEFAGDYADLRKIVTEANGDAEKIRSAMAAKKAADPEWYARVRKYEQMERDYVMMGEKFEPTRGRPLYPLTLTEKIALNEDSNKIIKDIDAFKKTETERMTEGLTAEERELWARANLDPMTGLYNRNGYLQAEKWVEEGKPITQASIDGDYFSAFNFVKGSEFGDQIIRTFGVEFQNAVDRLRKDNPGANVVAIRKGGEEFVIIATGIDQATMAAAANELRVNLKNGIQKACAEVDPGLLSTAGNPGKIETYLDAKGKRRIDPTKPLEVGDSTMGVIGFQKMDLKGPPPRTAKEMVEKQDVITDELMEANKKNTGRGKVYTDTDGTVYDTTHVDAHMSRGDLNPAQGDNVKGIHHPLAEEAEKRFTNYAEREQGKKVGPQLDALPGSAEEKQARRVLVEKIIFDQEFNLQKIRQQCKAHNIPDEVVETVLAAKREQLNIMQGTDRLTGTYSKPGIAAEIQAAKEAGGKPALYEIEPIQKFKPVNEIGGHLGGDGYMLYIANVLEQFCAPRGYKVGKSGVNFLIMSPNGPLPVKVIGELNAAVAKGNAEFFTKIEKNVEPGQKTMRKHIDDYIDVNLPAEAPIIKANGLETPKLTEIPTTSAGRPALYVGSDGKPLNPAKTPQVGTDLSGAYAAPTLAAKPKPAPKPKLTQVRAATAAMETNSR